MKGVLNVEENELGEVHGCQSSNITVKEKIWSAK